MSDAKLALINKLKASDGGLIISGTRSVAYSVQRENFYRLGGLGHLVGDQESGYSIGLACYKRLAYELDTKKELSTFSKDFFRFSKFFVSI